MENGAAKLTTEKFQSETEDFTNRLFVSVLSVLTETATEESGDEKEKATDNYGIRMMSRRKARSR